jgi:hypothetical protein
LVHGIYFTSDFTQASVWAHRIAADKVRMTQKKSFKPAVVHWKVPKTEIAPFKQKIFILPSDAREWADFVKKCRWSYLKHEYDWVEGPCYVNPDMFHEEPLPKGHQIAVFSTKLAKIIDRHVVEVKIL